MNLEPVETLEVFRTHQEADATGDGLSEPLHAAADSEATRLSAPSLKTCAFGFVMPLYEMPG